jgi:hypothetical protein
MATPSRPPHAGNADPTELTLIGKWMEDHVPYTEHFPSIFRQQHSGGGRRSPAGGGDETRPESRSARQLKQQQQQTAAAAGADRADSQPSAEPGDDATALKSSPRTTQAQQASSSLRGGVSGNLLALTLPTLFPRSCRALEAAAAGGGGPSHPQASPSGSAKKKAADRQQQRAGNGGSGGGAPLSSSPRRPPPDLYFSSTSYRSMIFRHGPPQMVATKPLAWKVSPRVPVQGHPASFGTR